METVDVCIYVFVKRVVCGSRTLYFDSVQFFPRIPPTSSRGVFIWFALDGAFDVQVLLMFLLVKVVNHSFISQKLS